MTPQQDALVSWICEQLLLIGALIPRDAPVTILLLDNPKEPAPWQRGA